MGAGKHRVLALGRHQELPPTADGVSAVRPGQARCGREDRQLGEGVRTWLGEGPGRLRRGCAE